MPKIKSHSGAKKRFSVNPKGKVKYASTDRGHFMTEKSQDRKRKLRKGGYLSGKQA
ncbi:MAG: 50S ribosomal protein L35 [Clostridia bacterium]|nr:50S ribosomal protein L35 [Clostridia bacterium]